MNWALSRVGLTVALGFGLVVGSQAEEAITLPPIHIERTLTLQPNEPLANLLTRHGVSASQAHQLMQPLSKKVNLRRLRPGQEVILSYQEDGAGAIERIESLALFTKNDSIATVAPATQGYQVSVAKRPLTQRQAVAVGHIEGSLYHAAKRAHLPAALVPAFANLFAWELDFTRDIHPGDVFKVVYEEVLDENGDFLRTGNIIAAELHARGKRRTAFRVTDARGQADYYDEAGQPKKKLLLRTPLEFTRISSHYNLNRKHPISGYTRAHKGTDFAAPTGTPVKASGSGIIEKIQWWGGYGRYIRIKHTNKYKTAYAHLHKFARGLKPGSRVRQGQVIGYVGTTGGSTGPHLHYEVLVHGKQVNAMRAKLPAGNPLPKAQRPAFEQMVASLKAKWDAAEVQLAQK